MATPNWGLFAVGAVVLTVALLGLSRLSARSMAVADSGSETGPPAVGAETDGVADSAGPVLPTGGALLANVALTHGLLALATSGLVWLASVPPAALGLAPPTPDALAAGLGLGVGLSLASETASALADRLRVPHDERLRELLSPGGPLEWAVLLLVVLPLIAGAEELLFRGVLVGAVGAGFGVQAWALVVGSSVLFGLGHSAQGGLGIAVTAGLGVVLGVAFVWTGSLLAVVIAHYVVDCLEFVVREGLLGEA